ncbi:hypothetical protein [Clavibacter michiganensis]|uniref:hypothetical protein n=1 Tax=Clavibacter michiganensis TaxID=28447 RepID=UPI003EB829E4
MTWLLIALNALAFVLPAIGFTWLLVRSQKALTAVRRLAKERGYDGASWQDVDDFDPADGIRERARQVRWDILFVLVGLACGSTANLIPLFAAL